MLIASLLLAFTSSNWQDGVAEEPSERPYDQCHATSEKIDPKDPRYGVFAVRSDLARSIAYKVHTECSVNKPYVYPEVFISDGQIIYHLSRDGIKVTINNKVLHSPPHPCILSKHKLHAEHFNHIPMPHGQTNLYGYLSNKKAIFLCKNGKVQSLLRPRIPVIDIGVEPGPHSYGGSIFLLLQEDPHTFYFLHFDN